LMRGTPSSSSSINQTNNDTPLATTGADGRPAIVERRTPHLPAFAPPATGRVYGGGSGSDGVFANLSAKPETGEKLEEHPPVSQFELKPRLVPPFGVTNANGYTIDLRTSRRRRSTSILGNHNPRSRTRRP
jgi:hypothetical protein